jgi:precorrin-6B methylase 2
MGDSSLDKLALVSGIAKLHGSKRLLEIGTASGFMARHLALNCGRDSRIWTIDLPEESVDATEFALERVDRDVARKVYRGLPPAGWYSASSPQREQIVHVLCDSAKFNFSNVELPLDFAYIDGAHSYDYVLSDSINVLQRVRPGGVVVWDDYRHFFPVLIRALGEVSHVVPVIQLQGTGQAVTVLPADWCNTSHRAALDALRRLVRHAPISAGPDVSESTLH